MTSNYILLFIYLKKTFYYLYHCLSVGSCSCWLNFTFWVYPTRTGIYFWRHWLVRWPLNSCFNRKLHFAMLQEAKAWPRSCLNDGADSDENNKRRKLKDYYTLIFNFSGVRQYLNFNLILFFHIYKKKNVFWISMWIS